MRSRLCACLVGSILVVGCGASDDPNPTPSGPTDPELLAGAVSVRVVADPFELTLERERSPLLTFPADGFQLGRVDEIDDTRLYDPYLLATEDGSYFPPEGLKWLSVDSAEVTEQTDERLQVALTHAGGKESTLVVTLDAEGRFGASVVPSDQGDDVAFIKLAPKTDASEGLLRSRRVLRRGQPSREDPGDAARGDEPRELQQ